MTYTRIPSWCVVPFNFLGFPLLINSQNIPWSDYDLDIWDAMIEVCNEAPTEIEPIDLKYRLIQAGVDAGAASVNVRTRRVGTSILYDVNWRIMDIPSTGICIEQVVEGPNKCILY